MIIALCNNNVGIDTCNQLQLDKHQALKISLYGTDLQGQNETEERAGDYGRGVYTASYLTAVE